MNKRMITLVFVVCALLIGGVVVMAAGGSREDPLISLSYLKNEFKASLSQDIEQDINASYDKHYSKVQQDMDDLLDEYRTGNTYDADDGLDYSGQYGKHKYSLGDELTLQAGSSILMREGAGTVTSNGGEIIDTTMGESAGEVSLASNRRYIVGEGATATMTVQSDAMILGFVGYSKCEEGKQNATPFTDMMSTQWYYDAVQFVYQEELFNGVSEDHFFAEGRVTRAMLATVLYRLASQPALAPQEETFSDVADGMWYESGVTWSFQTGIVNGMGDGTFAPNANVTRQQLAVMLYRYAKEYLGSETTQTDDLKRFKDGEDVADWAQEAMTWAVGDGIITGDPEGNLNPNGSASRAETATMMQRFISNIV